MVNRQWMASRRPWVCFYRVHRSMLHELTTMIGTMQQMASDINKMRRSLSIYATIVDRLRLHELQAISYKRTPNVGSALQIRRKTTTLDIKSIRTKPAHGSSKTMSSLSGSRRTPFYGSMENVRSPYTLYDYYPNSFRIM